MGLGLSSSKKNLDFGRYDWAATHACETNAHAWDGGYSDHASATGYNFEKGLQLAADGNLQTLGNKDSGVSIQDLLTTAGSDFGDKISFSMWIKPMWSHSGSKTAGNWSNGGTVLPLFQVNTSNPNGGDRSILAYLSFRTGTSFRNRMTIWTDSGDDRAGSQRAMHDATSVTGTGDTGNGELADLWDQDNPGNVNGQGYVHLAFVRDEGTGSAAWDVYWNAQDINMSIDIGTGDDEPQFTSDTAEFLGIGTYRAKTTSYNSAATPYNFSLTPMRIRDFAVFKGVMNLKDVQEVYNSGNFVDVRTKVGSFSQTDLNAGPVLYYPLNHNLADYARNSADLSGNVSFVAL